MSFVRRATASIAAGLALASAAPPLQWSLTAFAGPALLLWVLQARPQRPRPREAFGWGLLTGFTANAVALWWNVGLLVQFADFPAFFALLVSALLWAAQALPFALAAGVSGCLMRCGTAGWVVLPGALTVAFSVMPAVFPWRPSATQVPWLAWIQLAEWGGPPFLDLLFGWTGCATAELLRRPRGSLAVAAALLWMLPPLYGGWRLEQIGARAEQAPIVRVGVVQPNVGIEQKRNPVLWTDHAAVLASHTTALRRKGVDLVIWPETAFPGWLPRDYGAAQRALTTRFPAVSKEPLLFGAVTFAGGCERYNSVVATGRGGKVRAIADKVRLLAFGEYVPLWKWIPPLQDRFRCPGLRAGSAARVVSMADARVGVLNCYEDVLAGFTRRVAQQRPDFLVNVTNDAWFGQTNEPYLHHMIARMRSVETRRELIRAVNTGVSGHILATGAVAKQTPTWQQASFVASVRKLGGTTPWVRLGDLTTPLLIGLLLAWFARAVRFAPHKPPLRTEAS